MEQLLARVSTAHHMVSQQNKQGILKDNFLLIFIDSDSDTKTGSQKLNGSSGFSI